MSGVRYIQHAEFVALLAECRGDFSSAYATLVERFPDDPPSEDAAKRWMAALPADALGTEARLQVQRFIENGEADNRLLPLAQSEKRDLVDLLEAGALRTIQQVFEDTNSETFNAKTRATTALKFMEIMDTPGRLRAGRGSAPQTAHQNVPQVSSAFGRLTDRAVLLMYVREGERVDRLTEYLRASEELLADISQESVARTLQGWQRTGVVLDSTGRVVEWDDALNTLRSSLRIQPAPL